MGDIQNLLYRVFLFSNIEKKEERSMKEKERAVISNGKAKMENLGRDELRTLCTTVLKAILEKRTKDEKQK
jgi:hypothetical protein